MLYFNTVLSYMLLLSKLQPPLVCATLSTDRACGFGAWTPAWTPSKLIIQMLGKTEWQACSFSSQRVLPRPTQDQPATTSVTETAEWDIRPAALLLISRWRPGKWKGSDRNVSSESSQYLSGQKKKTTKFYKLFHSLTHMHARKHAHSLTHTHTQRKEREDSWSLWQITYQRIFNHTKSEWKRVSTWSTLALSRCDQCAFGRESSQKAKMVVDSRCEPSGRV